MKLVSAGYKVNGKLAYVTEDGTVLVTYDQYRRAAPGGGNRITVGEWTATHRTERDPKQPKYSFRNEPAQHPLLTLAKASTLEALKAKLDKLARQGDSVRLAGSEGGKGAAAGRSVLADLERLRLSRAVEYVLDQVVDDGEDFEAALKKAARLYELDAQERAQVQRVVESVGASAGESVGAARGSRGPYAERKSRGSCNLRARRDVGLAQTRLV